MSPAGHFEGHRPHGLRTATSIGSPGRARRWDIRRRCAPPRGSTRDRPRRDRDRRRRPRPDPARAARLLGGSRGGLFAAGARGPRRAGASRAGLAYAFAALMAAANALMVWALVTRNFSVGYVAHVGSRQHSGLGGVVSLWSSLEGSILFWGLVLGVYVVAPPAPNRDRHPEYMPYAAAVWLACGGSQLPARGPRAAVPDRAEPARGWSRTEPAPAEPRADDRAPALPLYGLRGHDHPLGLASAALLRGRLGHDFHPPAARLADAALDPPHGRDHARRLVAYEVLAGAGTGRGTRWRTASFLPWLTATCAPALRATPPSARACSGGTVTWSWPVPSSPSWGVDDDREERTFNLRPRPSPDQSGSACHESHGPCAPGPSSSGRWASWPRRIDRLSARASSWRGPARDGCPANNLLFSSFTFHHSWWDRPFPPVVKPQGVHMSVGRRYFDRMAVAHRIAAAAAELGVGPRSRGGRGHPRAAPSARLLWPAGCSARWWWRARARSFGVRALQRTASALAATLQFPRFVY